MEAVRTNVIGTENVLDKPASPTSLKRCVVPIEPDKAVYRQRHGDLPKPLMEKVMGWPPPAPRP